MFDAVPRTAPLSTSDGVDRDRAVPDVIAATSGLVKRFGAITALDQVSVEFRRGEVHGLVGANGAGKSTLVKILAGVHQPDAGSIAIHGRSVHLADPLDARKHGLGFIFQELGLIPKFSILRNLALGQWETRSGLVTWSTTRTRARRALERIGLDRSLSTPVGDLSVAEAWLVTIARALMYDAELVFMDEPTASLSAEEAARLFRVVESLSRAGVGVAYISHRLDEVVELCSKVSVFRDGRLVTSLEGEEITKEALVGEIIGPGRVAARSSRADTGVARQHGPVVFRSSAIARAPVVQGVDLTVHAGEVLGIAGLVGSGRTEFARIVFGAEKPDTGTMVLDGKAYAPRDIHGAIKSGVALVPEERRSQGLILDRSVSMNINLASLRQLRTATTGLLSAGKARARATEMISALAIKTPSPAVQVRQLSGGNQQKVVMAKWLVGQCRLLICDEPSRGVDVAARAEIYRLIREQADGGTAAIVISSEFDELKECDRVAVMREGKIVGFLDHNDISEHAILELCFAGASGPAKEES